MMCLGLVELALTSRRVLGLGLHQAAKAPRAAGTRPGAGFGETELNRLYYRLGWTRGWYKGELHDKVFGELAENGTRPDWKAIKTKLLSLARKYDSSPC